MKIYFNLILVNFKILWQFKNDFLLGVFSGIFEQGLSLVFIEIIFARFTNIGENTKGEIIVFYGFLAFALAVQKTYFDNIWNIPYTYIRLGELDRLLIKPQPVLLLIVSEKINITAYMNQVISLVIIFYGLSNLSIKFNFLMVILIIGICYCSGLLLASITLICATLAFWIVDSTPIITSFFSLVEIAKYPINLFSKFLAFMLTFIIPFGFAGYYPATVVLGNYLLVPMFLITVFVWVSISIYLWSLGMKNYTGISS